jgi:methionyl-tRNA formyltransferase
MQHDLKPGTMLSDGKTFLKFASRDGYLEILRLQAEGRNRMDTVEFLRGFNIREFAEL